MNLDLLRTAIMAQVTPATMGLNLFGYEPEEGPSRANSLCVLDQSINFFSTMRAGAAGTGEAEIVFTLRVRTSSASRESAQKHMDELLGTSSTKSLLLAFHYDPTDTSPLAVFFNTTSNGRCWVLHTAERFDWEDKTRVVDLSLEITCPY